MMAVSVPSPDGKRVSKNFAPVNRWIYWCELFFPRKQFIWELNVADHELFGKVTYVCILLDFSLFDTCIPLGFRSFFYNGNAFVFRFVGKMNTSHFHTTFPTIAFLIVSKRHARTSTQHALSSADELGTISKSNLRGITFG